ncbi:MAG TPA: alpha/beta hydrolase, partial [Streptosporangiaceae bacterium]|nr:alpha/beta hydrolase [Streptosporangiaceae bacterium]
MTERQIDAGNVSLAVSESGVGQRPLLLVHGFTGAKEDFAPWLEPLAAQGWHAVAPDLRGHGSSSKPAAESAYSFELMADDLVRLADALGWERFVLLGHSMGGMVAQYVALAAAPRLTGLILMDTAHGPLEHLDPDLIDAAVSVVRGQGMDALAAIMAERQGPLHTPAHQRLLDTRPGYAEFGERKLRATSPALYAAVAPEFTRTPDRIEYLRQLPEWLPVLVIVGEQDEPFIGPSRQMAAAITGGALAVIPDAGHSPQFENTDAWWQILTGYLTGLILMDTAHGPLE